MAETREQLEAQRTALRAAIRSGARDVQHGDKRVQYRTVSEMRSALDDLNADIDRLDGVKKAGRVFYLGGDRGF